MAFNRKATNALRTLRTLSQYRHLVVDYEWRSVALEALDAFDALDKAAYGQCGEVAWWTDWQPLGICTQPYGTEHSHSDHSVHEAVRLGLARYVHDDDVFRVSS